jgi:hypothetical protein
MYFRQFSEFRNCNGSVEMLVRDSAGVATLVKIGSCIQKLIVGTDKRYRDRKVIA